jgi:hypothetical protein
MIIRKGLEKPCKGYLTGTTSSLTSTHLIVLSARDGDSEETIQDTNHHVKDLAYT